MKDYDSWKTRSDFDDKWPPEEEWPENHREEEEPEEDDEPAVIVWIGPAGSTPPDSLTHPDES
jgi:hypothetical protein